MGITKKFFYGKPWTEILTDPGYQNLAHRELTVLRRFLADNPLRAMNVIHLGVGSFRELPSIIEASDCKRYVVNDIVPQVVEKTIRDAKKQYPTIDFISACGDIDQPETIQQLRCLVTGDTVMILTGNGVIFADRSLDNRISKEMSKDDIFLVTLETPHEKLADSYRIPACYELLSQSGLAVRPDNTKIWYDKKEQCLKVECEDRVLLASYKPAAHQLLQRMHAAGLYEIALAEYSDIHMLGGLFKRKE